MKKVFKLMDLDCANCAAKMENAIARLPGVDHVVVNFMTQKLTLEAADADFDRILDEVEKTMRKVEPDCTLVR
ncbi:MAG: cation transporter [Candidatus Limiplasma sp.]|nr:cation transporter [Clostridiales bacterium]MDY3816595.1 cation transporter [Candidatus Limiplasma sp.]